MNYHNKSCLWVAVATLLAVAAVVCSLSLHIVWYGDAFRYRFSFATGEPIGGLADIAVSQYAHFFCQNGRIVAHALAQVFCGLAGQTAFAVCNALAYICLILLLVRYAGGNWRRPATIIPAALLTLFFCDTSYIPPHQIGYIWMSCTLLIFLIIYDKQGHARQAGWGACALLLLVGLICGNGNESIDLGIGVALVIDMLRQGRRYGWRRLMLLAGFCTGLALLCLSPGQIVNATAISYRPPMMVSVYNLVVSLRAFWVFAVVLTVACLRRKVSLRDFVSDNWLLFTAMAVMLIFNIAITVKVNRQLFGIELYSAVLTMRLLGYFRIPALWLVAGAAVVAAQYYMKYTTLTDFNRDETELRRQLVEHGNSPLYIDLIHHNPYVHPTEEFTFHDCVNLNFHVMNMADDISGISSRSDRKDVKRLSIDSVALYPTALESISKLEPRNRVVYCGNGVYMLLRLKSHPARFVLHRSLDVMGLRRPLAPVGISFDASQHPSTDIYDVFVSTFPYPLMHVDSVTIE